MFDKDKLYTATLILTYLYVMGNNNKLDIY